MATVREFVERLTELSAELTDGLNSVIRFGVCDGDHLQLLDKVDVHFYTRQSTQGSPTGPEFVIIRGHVHPGEEAGELLEGVATHADEELRNLTDGDGPA